MKTIENQTLDAERALYALTDSKVKGCRFEGPADGESALKETEKLQVEDCFFDLRYPLWHTRETVLSRCTMTDKCRAALWYDRDVTLSDCDMNGIKALRECDSTSLKDCRIISPEFGWYCRGIQAQNTSLNGEYPFMHSRDITLDRFTLNGKYSFQYVENMVIRDSELHTKDAFWHTKNVTVYDSLIEGEYLAWYSENLKLVRCRIKGTQPLCYCKNLILEDCTMADADFSFEYSSVQATIQGSIISVKNPLTGSVIRAEHIGEIILDEYRRDDPPCKIIIS